jgi:hypothetical protein
MLAAMDPRDQGPADPPPGDDPESRSAELPSQGDEPRPKPAARPAAPIADPDRPPTAEPTPAAVDPAFAAASAGLPAPVAPPQPAAAPRPGERGLRAWLVIVAAVGGVGVLLGQVEMAGFAVLAGLFAATHAADLDLRWSGLHEALHWIVPIGGAAVFFTTAMLLVGAEGGATRGAIVAAVLSVLAGAISILTLFRPVADRLVARFFRGQAPSRTLRLAARLVLMGLLLSVPGWMLFVTHRDMLFDDRAMLGAGDLWGSLIGLVLVSLGGIGFLVRRDLREGLRRLGITGLGLRDVAVIPVGVVALIVVNGGLEALQRHFFPTAFLSDQEVNALIAGDLTRADALLLGLSAGIGEEISMRGALLPRLGLFWTSVLFAALHVQYSGYGMGVIVILGLVLGFIRLRTNTTTAMAVHAIYDVLAVLAAQQTQA